MKSTPIQEKSPLQRNRFPFSLALQHILKGKMNRNPLIVENLDPLNKGFHHRLGQLHHITRIVDGIHDFAAFGVYTGPA